jgi:hypothetical protein
MITNQQMPMPENTGPSCGHAGCGSTQPSSTWVHEGDPDSTVGYMGKHRQAGENWNPAPPASTFYAPSEGEKRAGGYPAETPGRWNL